jgi:hypothetical protein
MLINHATKKFRSNFEPVSHIFALSRACGPGAPAAPTALFRWELLRRLCRGKCVQRIKCWRLHTDPYAAGERSSGCAKPAALSPTATVLARARAEVSSVGPPMPRLLNARPLAHTAHAWKCVRT